MVSKLAIESYFEQIRLLIDSSPIVAVATVTYATRGRYTGYLRGSLQFVDDSMLHVREYLDVEYGIDRLMYVYQYMDDQNQLIFRYDDTDHHGRLGLSTHPHHKHDGSEANVTASHAPLLAEVLSEIEQIVNTFT